ncbi:MAG TPA: WYL domain-containing protein [Actinomycetes bacterium]|nr:WYL domain-containing protein [Actinomycetes bacterium]
MAKAERLVNLIALLLATRRPLTLDQVAELVPGYDAQGESLRRMFERDKDELRRLGVPIERAPVDAWGSGEGYFIDPRAYGMPQLELGPDERAALALALQVWSGGFTGGQPALAKLDLDPGAAARPLQADLQGGSPLVGAILDALHERRRITFTYRPPGREPARRRLDPYALVHRMGTWYVVGLDPDRDALRSFRLSRIQSEVRPVRPGGRGPEFEVPPGFDPGQVLPTAGERRRRHAVARVSEPAARLAVLRGGQLLGEPAGGVATARVPLDDEEGFLAWALGNEAEILEPPELRAEAARRLDALVARMDGGDGDEQVAALATGARAAEAAGGGWREAADAGRAAAPRQPSTAAGRVQRLLALVPWVLAHPGTTVQEACDRFGIDRATLLADLDLLFVSGLPPYGPGDLIEAWVEGDRIHIGFADYFSRAPRLSWREAVGLYLAGRALAAVPGLGEQDALERALKRLEASLPTSQLPRLQELVGRVSVDLEGNPVEQAHLATLTQAADEHRRVELEYYTGSRAELTRRIVDPWVLFPASGHWYLSGHCHRAGGERLFRLDRIVSVTPTTQEFSLPPDFDPAAHRVVPLDFARGPGVACLLALDAGAEWLATTLPLDGASRLEDGRLAVRFTARELDWSSRLVLRLAPAAVPLAPAALRQAVRAAIGGLRATPDA